MRHLLTTLGMAAIVFLGGSGLAFAQYQPMYYPPGPLIGGQAPPTVTRTMFGPRVFGRPLQPASTRFDGGLEIGPVGDFIGRGPAAGRMMFDSSPSAYGSAYRAVPGFDERLPGTGYMEGVVPPPQLMAPTTAPATPLTETPTPLTPMPMTPTTPPATPAAPGADQWLRTSGANYTPTNGAPVAATAVPTPEAPVAAARIAPLPPQMQVGFSVPTASQPAERVQGLLSSIGRIQKLSPITVSVENGTAVLRGRVATAEDRALAGTIAAMQPGISDVRNEISVGTQTGRTPATRQR